jgi:hypothetical protein
MTRPCRSSIHRPPPSKPLLTLRAYVESEGLFTTVINERSFDNALVDRILRDLDVG